MAALGRARPRTASRAGGPRPTRRRCSADRSQRAAAHSSPPCSSIHSSWCGEQEQRRERGRVVRLVEARVLERDRAGRATAGSSGRTRRCARCARSRRASSTRARARRRWRSTSAARSSRRRTAAGSTRSPPARRRARRRGRAPSAAGTPSGRRTSVMTPVDVSLWGNAYASTVGVGDQLPGACPAPTRARSGASRCGAAAVDARRTSTRTRRSTRCSAAPLDEPERGGVPERGGAAVAEQHLVAVGQREQLARGPRGSRPTTERTPSRCGGSCRGSRARRRRARPPPRGAPSTGPNRSGRRTAAARREADRRGVGHRAHATQADRRFPPIVSASRSPDSWGVARIVLPGHLAEPARGARVGPSAASRCRASCRGSAVGSRSANRMWPLDREPHAEREPVVHERRAGAPVVRERSGHAASDPVASITTIAAPRNVALSFCPGLNLPRSSWPTCARCGVGTSAVVGARPAVEAAEVGAQPATPASDHGHDHRDRQQEAGDRCGSAARARAGRRARENGPA